MSQPLPPGWYHDPLGGPAARYWNGAEWDGPPPADDELPQELPPENLVKSSRRLLVPVLVGSTVGLGVVLVALIVMWPSKGGSESQVSTAPNPTQAAAPASTIAATSTTAPAAEVADMVRASMQRKFDSDPDVSQLGLRVLKVNLVNKAGNEYKGFATIRAGNGEKEEVPVEVTADGDKILWETPPGALAFAIPDQPAPPSQAAEPPPLAPGVEHFEICPSGLSGVASDATSCASPTVSVGPGIPARAISSRPTAQ